jgi:hypothetical protein
MDERGNVKVNTLSPPMHFFLNSFLQQSVFCRCHLPLWLCRAAIKPPPPLWSIAAATQLLHIEVIVELLPRCSAPLARSHRGRRQADARSFVVLLVAPFLGSLCYSRATCAVRRVARCNYATRRLAAARRAASRYCHCRCPPTMMQLGASGRSGAARRSSGSARVGNRGGA